MVNVRSTLGPGVGLFFESKYCLAWNRCGATALVIGDLVMFDMGDTDTDTTTSLIEGNDGSVYANVIDVATLGLGGLSGATLAGASYFFGVVVDYQGGAGADNTLVRLQVQGIARVKMAATAIVVGVGLFGLNGTGRALSPTITAGNKILAIAHEPNGSAAGIYQCLFDGIHGFPGGPAAS